jgi:hypothetical protein
MGAKIKQLKKLEQELRLLRIKNRKYYLTRRVKKFAWICCRQRMIYLPQQDSEQLVFQDNKYIKELMSKYKFVTQLEIK